MKDKVIVWFSCGAASACAAKLASVLYGDELNVVYCDTMSSEHPDNQRFFNDVQRWIGRDITVIKSTRFDSVDEVFEKRKYLAGRLGAPCTVEMKKRPRFEFQGANDVHIFGMTADEAKRAKRFTENNPELRLRWILEESGLTKEGCLEMLKGAGIELPAMYKLGYKNNNCIGCVKATSPAYWNKVRADFPEVFEKRCQQSRLYGARLVRVNNVRLFLDELKPENVEVVEEDLSCGPQCTGVPEGYESLEEPLIEPIIEPTESALSLLRDRANKVTTRTHFGNMELLS